MEILNNKNLNMSDCWGKEKVSEQEVKRWVVGYSTTILWKKFHYWKKRLGLPKSSKTVETGCGYGKFSLLLGLRGEKVTLIDYNPGALESALQAHRSIGLSPESMAGDMIGLSHTLERRFDIVCSFGTLEHFSGNDRYSAFMACARYLKTGGMLFFTVPNRHGYFYRVAFSLRKKLGLFPSDFFEEPYSKRELRDLAAACGVKIMEIEALGTIKEDFDYWIAGNFKSLVRRLTKNKKTGVIVQTCPESGDVDLSASRIKDGRNWLDKRFSYNLLFVGQKI